MLVIIRIPSSLRNLADARDNFLTEASTVGEALDCLLKDYPDLKPHLEDERGNLPPFINVFLNEEDIPFSTKEPPSASKVTKLVSWPPSLVDRDFPESILIEQALLADHCIVA